jgi:hypothetical protein
MIQLRMFVFVVGIFRPRRTSTGLPPTSRAISVHCTHTHTHPSAAAASSSHKTCRGGGRHRRCCGRRFPPIRTIHSRPRGGRGRLYHVGETFNVIQGVVHVRRGVLYPGKVPVEGDQIRPPKHTTRRVAAPRTRLCLCRPCRLPSHRPCLRPFPLPCLLG